MGNFILNTLWFCTLGWIAAAIILAIGVLMCATVLGIPVGIACFSLIMTVAFPFGRQRQGGVTIINNRNE